MTRKDLEFAPWCAAEVLIVCVLLKKASTCISVGGALEKRPRAVQIPPQHGYVVSSLEIGLWNSAGGGT